MVPSSAFALSRGLLAASLGNGFIIAPDNLPVGSEGGVGDRLDSRSQGFMVVVVLVKVSSMEVMCDPPGYMHLDICATVIILLHQLNPDDH